MLQKKGVRYDVTPIAPGAMPDWLKEKHDGQLPVLRHNDITMTDSLAIAEYLEQLFPLPSLTRRGMMTYQEALQKVEGFLPAAIALARNRDENKEEKLWKAMEAELDNLDLMLRSTPGKYLAGIDLTLADLYMLPLLFQTMIGLNHLKGFEFYHDMPKKSPRPALEVYMSRLFKLPEFNERRTYLHGTEVACEWKSIRDEGVAVS